MCKINKLEDFIRRSKIIHNNFYDYSLVDYKTQKIKVKIICPTHGIFEQMPDSHLTGSGCYKCSLLKKTSTSEFFIEKSVVIHNNFYDYSLVNYINQKTKVKIICPIHGEFLQRPDGHLNGSGCISCSNILKTKSNEHFIKESNNIHNNRYDYSLTKYKNVETNIEIICREHGIFEQRPDHHLNGYGCSKCGKINSDNKQRKPITKLLNEFFSIHNNTYDYSLVDYINTYTPVQIICKEHGIFEQQPREHLKGAGCPKCNNSKGEKTIELYLQSIKLDFETQKIFPECKYKLPLKFDFYIPQNNICIEFDGKQHFKSNEYFGGENNLKVQQIRDNIKNEYCLKNNIKLIRIPYYDINNIKIILDENLVY